MKEGPRSRLAVLQRLVAVERWRPRRGSIKGKVRYSIGTMDDTSLFQRGVHAAQPRARRRDCSSRTRTHPRRGSLSCRNCSTVVPVLLLAEQRSNQPGVGSCSAAPSRAVRPHGACPGGTVRNSERARMMKKGRATAAAQTGQGQAGRV